MPNVICYHTSNQVHLVVNPMQYTAREAMAAELQRRLFTVEDCYKMAIDRKIPIVLHASSTKVML